ncbi:bifunctional Methionyl-Valyl-Leucyl-Isoleucyl-tRNA synthetase [Babesia duncani]|uniref:leucine--tRNA ligase n=1 Tax=Babesia duncani TaxID=323732 RepID=A0AAD9PK58_9APIC|nr:bifunctional Methionyl-Valyl-Leucyl-Isoleucyl-tRNA synthetase [Babesia duncani]
MTHSGHIPNHSEYKWRLCNVYILVVIAYQSVSSVLAWKCRFHPEIYLYKNFQCNISGRDTTLNSTPSAGFNAVEIDKKWQRIWDESELFHVQDSILEKSEKLKFYALPMIPYPSGDGLHVGHLLGYTILDVVCRFKRMQGYRVLCPMGWDAFGLPAERFANEIHRNVETVTAENIRNFKRQLKSLGYALDWSREINTSDAKFYKWTQWTFLHFFKNGLAYRATELVNWCPAMETVLANEEVKNGKSIRGGYPVYRKPMQQWMLKITKYARQLVDGLENLDWPERIKLAQRRWIGIQEGFKIQLRICNFNLDYENTLNLFGFVQEINHLANLKRVLVSIDSEIAKDISKISKAKSEIESLAESTCAMSNLQRYELQNQRFIDTGIYIVNPVNGSGVPLVVTNVPIATSSEINVHLDCSPNDAANTVGIMSKSSATPYTNLKLRDWVFSRRRAWGEPIPLRKTENGYEPLDKLPVMVGPDIQETMPQWAGSSWHFLRFTDPNNDAEIFNRAKASYWLPVDLYVGGAEHATSHLMYARFWTRALYDLGISPCQEPFKKLLVHGMILMPSFSLNGVALDDNDVIKYKGNFVLKADYTPVTVKYDKMSKSRGNVVSPDGLLSKYGADALRCHLLFLGPIGTDKVWNSGGLIGIYRLLTKIYMNVMRTRLYEGGIDKEVLDLKDKIDHCIQGYKFNVAIANFFKFLPILEQYRNCGVSKTSMDAFIKLLSPFCPHLAEELWHGIGNDSLVSIQKWQGG